MERNNSLFDTQENTITGATGQEQDVKSTSETHGELYSSLQDLRNERPGIQMYAEPTQPTHCSDNPDEQNNDQPIPLCGPGGRFAFPRYTTPTPISRPASPSVMNGCAYPPTAIDISVAANYTSPFMGHFHGIVYHFGSEEDRREFGDIDGGSGTTLDGGIGEVEKTEGELVHTFHGAKKGLVDIYWLGLVERASSTSGAALDELSEAFLQRLRESLQGPGTRESIARDLARGENSQSTRSGLMVERSAP